MNDETLRLSLVKFITCRVHKKTLGVPRLFHATTKIQYHKSKDNDERDKSECLEIRELFFFHFSHMHTTITMQFYFIYLFLFFFLFFSFSFSETFYDRVEKNRRKIGFSDFFIFVHLNISPFFSLSFLFYGRDE